jgi:hypothetical protein
MVGEDRHAVEHMPQFIPKTSARKAAEHPFLHIKIVVIVSGDIEDKK